MNPLSNIITSSRGYLIVVIMILLFAGQLFLCLWTFRQRRAPFWRFWDLLITLMEFSIMTGLMNGLFVIQWRNPQDLNALEERLFASPCLITVGIEVILFLLLVSSAVANFRYRSRHMTGGAIKETMDLLPVAICFGDRKGRVVMANLKIQTLCRAMTGRRLTDIPAFWQAIMESGTEQNGQYLVEADRSYLFVRKDIHIEERPYTQITATDVTDLYRVSQQLQKQNRRLQDLLLRMRAYSAEAYDLAMDREILNARIAVHDEIGHVLLLGRYYLEHPEMVDEAGFLSLFRQTNESLLYEAEQPDDAITDAVEAAIRMAQRIGVEVRISGTYPVEGAGTALLAQAIRESAANTIKHADGKKIEVEIEEDDFDRMITIRSDGKVSAEPVRPKGGLLSLQQALEAAGGELQILNATVFTLRLRLPKEMER